MAQLCAYKEQWSQLDTEVLVITFNAPLLAKTWLAETGSCFELLLDPDRNTYRQYGLEKSLLRSWSLRVLLRYVELIRRGAKWRGIQGDSSQLGGDFVVDAQGIVRLAYRSRDPTDRPSVSDIVDVLSPLAQANREQT